MKLRCGMQDAGDQLSVIGKEGNKIQDASNKMLFALILVFNQSTI